MADGAQSTITFIAACTGIGAFIDFFLGKRGQTLVRNHLESWWIQLADLHLRTFAREEAKFARDVLYNLFGTFLSVQRAKASIVLTCCAVIAWTALEISGNTRPVLDFYWRLVPMTRVRVIFSFLAMWCSISFTLWCAEFVIAKLKENALINLATYFLFCTLQIYVLTLSNTTIDLFTSLIYFGDLALTPQRLNEQFHMYLTEATHPTEWTSGYFLRGGINNLILDLSSPNNSSFGFYNYISRVYGYFASALRIAIAIIFLISCLFRPFHRTLLLVLQRLAESEKPVFTLLFSGLGALAKFIQALSQALGTH
jgi:hypothetical protein